MYCDKPKKHKCEYYDVTRKDKTDRCRISGGCKYALGCIGKKCKKYKLQGTTPEGFKYCSYWIWERCYVVDDIIKSRQQNCI